MENVIYKGKRMTKKTEFDDKFEEIIYYYIRNDWFNLENAIDSLEKMKSFVCSEKTI